MPFFSGSALQAHTHATAGSGGLIKLANEFHWLLFEQMGSLSTAFNGLNAGNILALTEPTNYNILATEIGDTTDIATLLRKTYTPASFSRFTSAVFTAWIFSAVGRVGVDSADLFDITGAASIAGSTLNATLVANVLLKASSGNIFAALPAVSSVLTVRVGGDAVNRTDLVKAEIVFS